jgi:hypothetical protein
MIKLQSSKNEKGRIAIFVCPNMYGSERLSFFEGKSKYC